MTSAWEIAKSKKTWPSSASISSRSSRNTKTSANDSEFPRRWIKPDSITCKISSRIISATNSFVRNARNHYASRRSVKLRSIFPCLHYFHAKNDSYIANYFLIFLRTSNEHPLILFPAIFLEMRLRNTHPLHLIRIIVPTGHWSRIQANPRRTQEQKSSESRNRSRTQTRKRRRLDQNQTCELRKRFPLT